MNSKKPSDDLSLLTSTLRSAATEDGSAATHFKGWAKPGLVPLGLGAPNSDSARSNKDRKSTRLNSSHRH